ncbi:MAG TPA: hypothetical protein DCX07_00125 [Phycisphaerales bacterium]|nr:hypothetical protein [Phycisphaerales bacterium]
MQTSREVVWNTIRFQGPDRFAHDFPGDFGTDFSFTGLSPGPDHRPPKGADEWGAVWENLGGTHLGEVKDYPLKDWSDWGSLKIPDVNDPARWKNVVGARERAGDKFLIGYGLSLYERVHFLRGLENTWADIYENPEPLGRLVDVLAEMNLAMMRGYAAEGVEGLMWCDDWGLQDRLMISPDKWREIWKPRYARVYAASHAAGMSNWLHSCGYIVDILDDLIEIGLDAIHMDQQENMGLELLGRRFGGRITFFSCADIQTAMQRPPEQVRQYCREMVRRLSTSQGGFIPRWYTDPQGAGHSQQAIAAMCEEFLRLSKERYGR